MCLWISSFSVPVNVCFSSQYAEGHKHLHAETKIHRKWIAALLQRVRGEGLRAATLRKRVSDWGPFLQYLRAHTGKVFPAEKSEVLAYFSVRAEEHAARSVYRALLTSLRFFEEAGEVPLALRLTAGQALEGAVREHERK